MQLTIDGYTFEVEDEQMLEIASRPMDMFLNEAGYMTKVTMKTAINTMLAMNGVQKPDDAETFEFGKRMIFGAFIDYAKDNGLVLRGEFVGKLESKHNSTTSEIQPGGTHGDSGSNGQREDLA